jgi:hypothetical protein
VTLRPAQPRSARWRAPGPVKSVNRGGAHRTSDQGHASRPEGHDARATAHGRKVLPSTGPGSRGFPGVRRSLRARWQQRAGQAASWTYSVGRRVLDSSRTSSLGLRSCSSSAGPPPPLTDENRSRSAVLAAIYRPATTTSDSARSLPLGMRSWAADGQCTAISPPRANGAMSSMRSPLQNRPGSYQLAGRRLGSSPMCW